MLPLFDWRLVDKVIVRPSQTGVALESIAVIVHQTIKSSHDLRKKKNAVIYAEARDFVMKRLPEQLQAEIQKRSRSGHVQLLAKEWQTIVVPVIVELMPGFFIGTVRAQWGTEKVLSCFPDC
jgi:hypothetical protein